MPLRIRKPAVRNTPGPIFRGILTNPRTPASFIPSPLFGEPFEATSGDRFPYFDDGYNFEDD